VPSFVEAAQIAEDIRNVYFKEVKTNGMRGLWRFAQSVLTEGLEGLVRAIEHSK